MNSSYKLCALCLSCYWSFFYKSFKVIKELKNSLICKSFYSSYSCSNTWLRYNLKKSDVSCIGNMCTTTELLREVTHTYNSYLLTILFTKKCHSTCVLSFFDCHNLCLYWNCLSNLFIDNIFDLLNLLFCHTLEMCKVKS